ncbi:hypothetical protein L2E82_02199 [Cichorium intybus]|uniref:Uncharacterized protein n=1 Tax=Cichorium intybus TaxID=13427 RepID=A0ACB9H0Y6_CICIN|nr:hypothetical protein L2E82_02199 [Cichorium intybus]
MCSLTRTYETGSVDEDGVKLELFKPEQGLEQSEPQRTIYTLTLESNNVSVASIGIYSYGLYLYFILRVDIPSMYLLNRFEVVEENGDVSQSICGAVLSRDTWRWWWDRYRIDGNRQGRWVAQHLEDGGNCYPLLLRCHFLLHHLIAAPRSAIRQTTNASSAAVAVGERSTPLPCR